MKRLAIIAAMVWSLGASAQESASRYVHLDSLLQDYFQELSGDAGEPDWTTFKGLFKPGARINAINYNRYGETQARFGDLEGYIRNVTNFRKSHAMYQEEIFRETKAFGNIAQVQSTYYLEYNRLGNVYEDRGVIGFHLVFEQNRWWILQILWNQENLDDPIPNRYLPAPNPPETIRENEKIYAPSSVDVEPLYDAGQLALIRDISSGISIPQVAKDSLKGPLKIAFTVGRTGKAKDVRVLAAPSPEIAQQAIKAVDQLPLFTPGMVNGVHVDVAYPVMTIELPGIEIENQR